METYPFARDAVREAVFNALIHCNWADNVPVQIRIKDNARVFYRAGYIESWGRGIQKIRDACKNLGSEEPEYIVHGEDIMVKFTALPSAKISDSKASDSKASNRHDDGLDVGLADGLENEIVKLVSENSKITMAEIAEKLNVTKHTIERMVKSLRENAL